MTSLASQLAPGIPLLPSERLVGKPATHFLDRRLLWESADPYEWSDATSAQVVRPGLHKKTS